MFGLNIQQIANLFGRDIKNHGKTYQQCVGGTNKEFLRKKAKPTKFIRVKKPILTLK